MSKFMPTLTEYHRNWIAIGGLSVVFCFGMFVVLFVH